MHILAYALVMNIPLTQLLEILQLVLLVVSPGHVKDVRLRIATRDRQTPIENNNDFNIIAISNSTPEWINSRMTASR